jgi:methylmalonyl-CoA mutase
MVLFNEFPPFSSAQWKQQIQFELRGADYNDALVWESPEGIKVKPFYHRDENKSQQSVHSGAGFIIAQDIFVFDLEKSIHRAKDSLERGAQSIRFIIADAKTDVEKLIQSLQGQQITLFFSLQFLDEDFIKRIDHAVSKSHHQAFIHCDVIHQLTQDGNWFTGADNLQTLGRVADQCSHISVLSVDGTIYQNAGANMIQQVAYTLAQANEYLNRVQTKKPILVRLAVGSNYFFEIAKLRAFRLLFNLIAKEYGHTQDCHLLAVPTKRNKTLYDYNINMLRTTTECMSAILGGADTVCNMPYDALYHKSNEFGERIARNQLLILKYESYFGAVANPADGSYYIEELTRQIADKALKLFKEVEAKGGLIESLKEGVIQKKIRESAESEQELFDQGKAILVGTNKHPNPLDRMANDLELFPFVKTKPRKTLVTPIIEKRLAEKLEQQRLTSEKETQ